MRKRQTIYIVFAFLVYLIGSICYIKFEDNYQEDLYKRERLTFFHKPFQWKVLKKFIDSPAHMSHELHIKTIDTDSQFIFMPSSLRLPPSFYDFVQRDDTIIKQQDTLLVLVKNGKRLRYIQCDTWYWTDNVIR